LIWASHTNLAITIDIVTITDFTVAKEGGLLWTDKLLSLSVTNSFFFNFKAGVAGSFLKSTSPAI
jgi:hypothetical protein